MDLFTKAWYQAQTFSSTLLESCVHTCGENHIFGDKFVVHNRKLGELYSVNSRHCTLSTSPVKLNVVCGVTICGGQTEATIEMFCLCKTNNQLPNLFQVYIWIDICGASGTLTYVKAKEQAGIAANQAMYLFWSMFRSRQKKCYFKAAQQRECSRDSGRVHLFDAHGCRGCSQGTLVLLTAWIRQEEHGRQTGQPCPA